MKLKELKSCRICFTKKLVKYLNLGNHPYSNSFLSKGQIPKEIKYPLELKLCKKCGLSQLSVIPNTKKIFSDYDYLSSSSSALDNHYLKLVKKITKKYNINKNDTVLDVGCNDGVLLKHYIKKTNNIVGIEPSNAIEKIKNKNKINIINKFFNFKTSKEYLRKYKRPRIITITNVLAQIDDLNNFVKGLRNISDNKTVIIIEFPYSLLMFDYTFFDLIYHEHLSYFNLSCINYLFEKFNFSIIDYEKIDLGASGPAIRIYITTKNSEIKRNKKKIKSILQKELKWGIKKIIRYKLFSFKVEKKINHIRKIIYDLFNKNKSIGCFTASAKGNTLLNCLKIEKKIIKYTCENNKRKIGKYMPGTHIKIISDNEYLKKKIDYSLLLSWNYANFFLNNSSYKKRGGKFIIPFPKISIK